MYTVINTKDHEPCEDCKYYATGDYNKFILYDLQAGTLLLIDNEKYNHLIFILKGKLLIGYDDISNTIFSDQEIAFIPPCSTSHIEALENAIILIGAFEYSTDIYTLRIIESIWGLKLKVEYKFAPTTIKHQMKQFLDLLILYLENGLQCACLQKIKRKEIFLVFRWFYTDEEFVKLFYPILGKSVDFRSLIINNYAKVSTVEELAKLMNMSRSNFDAKFKDVFEMPPKQWILKQKAQNIKYHMSKPGVTINELMLQYDFDSFTHFNRFCKQQFGTSPSQLMKEIKASDKE